jgi:hypothetical protein
MSRRSAVLLLLAGLCRPAGATDTVTAVDLIGDVFTRGDPAVQGWLRIAPRATRRLSPRVVLVVAPVLEVDTHGDVDRTTVYVDDDRGSQRALLRFDRLSLRFELGAVRLEVGKQPLTWGRTDAINPTDNLTPRDWTDPLREVRLSPWAVRVNVEKRRWEGELALVPRYAPSRLPRLGGRWAMIELQPVASPSYPATGPPELLPVLGFGDPGYPSVSLDDLQAGLRLGRRSGRGEWALSYYRGFDDAPHFDLSVGPPDPGTASLPVTLQPRFPRLEVFGADGVLLAGAWALRGEAARFRFPEGLDEDFLLWELDAEWTRRSWQLVVGYAEGSGAREAGALDTARAERALAGAAASAVSLDLGFLPVAFLHLGRSVPTEWESGLDVLIGTEELDSLVQVSGSWPLGDTLRLGAELDLLSGPRGSFFGSWRDNDRLRLFARMSF